MYSTSVTYAARRGTMLKNLHHKKSGYCEKPKRALSFLFTSFLSLAASSHFNLFLFYFSTFFHFILHSVPACSFTISLFLSSIRKMRKCAKFLSIWPTAYKASYPSLVSVLQAYCIQPTFINSPNFILSVFLFSKLRQSRTFQALTACMKLSEFCIHVTYQFHVYKLYALSVSCFCNPYYVFEADALELMGIKSLPELVCTFILFIYTFGQ